MIYTSKQDECVQYGGPYGAILLASAALHVKVCHKQTACNKCSGREQGFCLLWVTGAKHRLGQVLECRFWYFLDYNCLYSMNYILYTFRHPLTTYTKAV